MSAGVRRLMSRGGMLRVPPLPGGLRPEWLLVVLKSLEILVTACPITKTTKITEECSDCDVASQLTKLSFLMTRGGVVTHAPSKMFLAKICVILHMSAPCMLQISHIHPALWQNKWRGGAFLLAVENQEGRFYDPCSPSSYKNHTSHFPALQHRQLCSQWKQWSTWRKKQANTEGKIKIKPLDDHTCRSTLYIHIIFSHSGLR